MKTIQFAVVSPEREIRAGAAELVVIPAEEGEMGVMAGHQPMVAAIKAGVVILSGGDAGAGEKIFVRGGFAEATPERVQILAEDAEPLARLDAQTVRDRRKHAEGVIAAGGDDLAIAAARADIEKLDLIAAAL